MTTRRPPRVRPISADALENVAPAGTGPSDAEIYDRLEEALFDLPEAERIAAVVAVGKGEGIEAVAARLGLDEADAAALTDSALQLLRGALADVELDEPELHAQLIRRRRRTTTEAASAQT